MLVCRIEMWPRGNKAKSYPVGLLVIANDGTGTVTQGNYECALAHSGKYRFNKGAWKTGRVHGFLRKLSPYHLILQAIERCLFNNDPVDIGDSLIESTKDKIPTEEVLLAPDFYKFLEKLASLSIASKTVPSAPDATSLPAGERLHSSSDGGCGT